MKKNLLKLLSIIIFFVIFFSNFSYVKAEPGWNVDFEPSSTGISTEVTRMESFGNKIIGIFQTVGVAGGVILLIILGVRYMMAAPSEKADIKKTSLIYILGAILLFSATGILTIIRAFAIDIK